MKRLIKDDLYVIGETVSGSNGYEPVRVYVMLNGGAPILIDTGSQIHREEIMETLEHLIGEAVPSHIFLTHSELPHAGNLRKIVERWPDIRVMVSSILLNYIEIAPIMPLEQIIMAQAGSEIEINGRRIEFVNAFLKDQPGSHWIYDKRTDTLFCGDGFGYYLASAAEDAFPDEPHSSYSLERLADYHREAFQFLRWTIPAKLSQGIDYLFERYPAKIIAPSHGNPFRADIPAVINDLKLALDRISQSYRA